jgi:ABC-2 type transport system permease protein
MSTLAILIRHRLRRDRIQIPVWIVSIAALLLFSALALQDTFGGIDERTLLVRLASANPAIMFIRGVPQGTDAAAVLIFTVLAFLGVLVGLMNTFLAVRHLRAEEESGRADLVASTPAARTFAPLATLLYGLLVNAVLAIAVAGCLLLAGQDASGSLVTGLALASIGVVFLTVGGVASELMPSARAANGLAVGTVLFTYLLRGIADAFGTVSADGLSVESAWPAWLSPIGWAQKTRPFTENTLAPLLLSGATALLLVGIAMLIMARRDTGASVLATTSGRMTALPTLAGPFGLAWRLQWPSIVAWCVGAAAFGVFGGSLGTAVATSDLGNSPIADQLARLSRGGDTLTEAFISVIFTIVGVVAAGCAIQAIVRMRQEEAHVGGELVLATPVARHSWAGSFLGIGAIAIVLVLGAGATASVIAALAVGAPDESIEDSVLAAVAQLPAALLFLALVALVWSIAPRLTAGLGWGLLVLSVFLGIFGALVGLPDWTADLSPFSHTPVPSGADTDWSGGIVMTGLALLAGGAAFVFFRRRDVESL